jgi:2-polyprenyl-3-methyl-5-hydroxy-6-metoxy-1,4-benzoquinol methylase
MTQEIQFEKYSSRSADYHYTQINKKKLKSLNSYTLARYEKQIHIILSQLTIHEFPKDVPLKVLDMGCGDGVLLYLFKKNNTDYQFQLFGIDTSDEAIETAKHKISDGMFFTNSVYETEFDDHFFDLIISSDLIEHLMYPEKMLLEIRRICKQGGLVIIGTPIRISEKPLDMMHVKEFFPQEFKDFCLGYLCFIDLIESHKLIHTIQYLKQSPLLKIGFNRYLYNLLTIFGKNKFLEKIHSSKDFPTYMYVVLKN